jgi:Spy/CpxP family protein refolding chaperone
MSSGYRMSLRACAGIALAAWMVGRPVRLVSVRWWRVPEIAASLDLTIAQRDAIDRMYDERLVGRRRCVERLVEASNRVDKLLEDGVYDADVLRETQAAAVAATDERTLRTLLSHDIVAVLSPHQRARLVVMFNGRFVD